MIKLRKEEIFSEDDFHIAETIIENEKSTSEHTHDFWEIFIIKEGEVLHFINGDMKVLKKDDLCLVRPTDRHYYKKGNCKSVRFINVAFSEGACNLAEKAYKIYGSEFKTEEGMAANIPDVFLTSILSKISYLTEKKIYLQTLPTRDILISILTDCFCVLNNQRNAEETPPLWLELACSEMQKKENYMIGIQQFVKLSLRSREHLARCMQRYYHLTPGEYINNIRLRQAAILLETTNDTIMDILLECGYENVSYFNRLFKMKYGMTPSRYRNINKKIIVPH